MKIFPWLFAWYRLRNRREQIVLTGGGAAVAIALLYSFVGAPLMDSWLQRETEITLRAEQLTRLRALIDREDDYSTALAQLQDDRAAMRNLFLEGETPAIAASALLVLLNRSANESRVVLERVDVADEAEETDGSLVSIPARVSATGDVYGLVDFLFQLQHGEKLLVVDEFYLAAGNNVRSTNQLARWTIDLHGYYVRERTS